MKTESEIRLELNEVRQLLSKLRANGLHDDIDMLYGAQQALGWILGELEPPSEMEKMIYLLAQCLKGINHASTHPQNPA